MRTIPYELRQRLLKDIQTKSTDAEPQLRVVATQSTTNTLLSEIIHKDIPASYGDVAIRQLAGEKEPSLGAVHLPTLLFPIRRTMKHGRIFSQQKPLCTAAFMLM